MASEKLRICKQAKFRNPRLLLGLSGWMNGCDISTGTIEYFIEKLSAKKLAEIEPEGFYIYNFPGPMELSAMFRPHTEIEEGRILSYIEPTNTFFCDEENDLVLFSGKEPNLNWHEYADCIFSLCEQFGIKTIYFIGSVAGVVPHTRQPRIFCSVSDKRVEDSVTKLGVKFSNYHGPASIITYITANAKQHDIDMASFVAEIPAYVQGRNPRCINALIKRLAAILDLDIDYEELRITADKFEKKLNELVLEHDELASHILTLEENYDNEVFNTEMGDLKEWLEQQGIRVD